MASITSWMRLEPRSRRADMNAGLQALIYDPLWLLARQWQVGEFQGEDNGSPASARWRGEVARVASYFPGTTVEGQAYDGGTVPLETLVERERVRTVANEPERLRFAAEGGQHFLRMLDGQPLSRSYRDLLKNKYPFPALDADQRAALDADSQSFLDIVGPRVPDGRQLYAALRTALPTSGGGSLPTDLPIALADVAEVQVKAKEWLRWYESFFSEPGGGGNPAWMAERMEYNFSIAAGLSTGEKILSAPEYYSGQLDWHDFNVNDGASLSAGTGAPATPLTRTTIPSPVSYRGMPAPRFWEFEDSQVDFGAVDAGPEELARMLLVEFAISYGNDWFVIPIDLPVGSLCRTRSLVVTNTFGERTLIRPSHQSQGPAALWRMFHLAPTSEPGRPPELSNKNKALFFLPPSLVKSLEARPLEEVLFLRDEMANMAWGVERVIESATERPLNRYEQQPVAPTPATAPAGEALTYLLATDVPDYWIPLLPVQSDTGLRLKRGAMLKVEGQQEPIKALGHLLNPDPPNQKGLAIFEEELPCEGIRVTRHYQLARWQDGSTHLWIGRRKRVGSGEGSSGLKFDTLKP
jgi:hypothetical protein